MSVRCDPSMAMAQDERRPLDDVLHTARASAYGPGGFVGQESFMSAGEILRLAERAGVARGTSVLDLCCGVAGPGRFLTRRLGCTYLGIDRSAGAIDLARQRAGDLPCRFEVGQVPPVPSGPFDVVLLLETMLAFPDKEPLLHGVSAALRPGGRFAFTLEEGEPLTASERARMPGADTVWLVPWSEMVSLLERAGLRVRWQEGCTGFHQTVVDSLVASFSVHASEIASELGREVLDELLAAHRRWSEWLGEGRARKLAVVAERS